MEKLVGIQGKEEERRNTPKVEINVKWRGNTKESRRWIKMRKADLPRCVERGGGVTENGDGERKRRHNLQDEVRLGPLEGH